MELDGNVFLRNKHLNELDVSHNQITALKLNEVSFLDFVFCVLFLVSTDWTPD